MFVQSVKFIRAHASGNGNGGKAKGDLSIYGQEVQLHHLASSPDELGDPGHRGPDDRASSPIPHSMSPTGAANGCATTSGGSTACRRWATPTSPGCSTSSTTWRPGERPASCWPTDQCPRARRRDPQEPDRGRSGGLHCGAAWPAVPLYPDTRLPLVPVPGPSQRGTPGPAGRDFVRRRPQAGPHDRPNAPATSLRRTSPASPTTLPRLARIHHQ